MSFLGLRPIIVSFLLFSLALVPVFVLCLDPLFFFSGIFVVVLWSDIYFRSFSWIAVAVLGTGGQFSVGSGQQTFFYEKNPDKLIFFVMLTVEGFLIS